MSIYNHVNRERSLQDYPRGLIPNHNPLRKKLVEEVEETGEYVIVVLLVEVDVEVDVRRDGPMTLTVILRTMFH